MRPPIAALALLLLPGTRPDAPPPSEPTAAYEARRVEGWPVLISSQLRDDPALAAEVLKPSPRSSTRSPGPSPRARSPSCGG